MVRNLRAKARVVSVLVATIASATAVAVADGGSALASSGNAAKTPLTVPGGDSTSLLADFNPFEIQYGSANWATSLLYLPLEGYNSLKSTYTPYLATGFKVISPKEVLFTLRRGVRWTNGKPVTAADVVFTFDLLKKFPPLDTSGVWTSLKSVAATRTGVRFTMSKPNSQIAPELAQVPILPKAVWSAVSSPVTFANASPTVTDGPYKLASFSTVKTVFVKSGSYYGAAAMSDAPDTVDSLPAPSGPTSLLQLEEGTFDINAVNDSDRGGFKTDWVDKDPKYNTFWAEPGSLMTTMYMNLSEAPFNNPKFRLALSYGIDRSAASKAANVNGYEPAASQTGLGPSQFGLVPKEVSHDGYVTYQPVKARKLLESAGFKYSGGTLKTPSGAPVSFTLQTVQGFTDWLGDANAIVADLGKLGITVTLEQEQFATESSDVTSGQFQAALYFSNTPGIPYFNYVDLLSSALTSPVGKPAAGDFERFNSASANALLGQVAAASSPSVADRDLGKLANVVYEQVPVIEIVCPDTTLAFSSKHYKGWPSASDPYATAIPQQGGYLEVIPRLKAVG